MNYLRVSEAIISDIKPGARLYVSLGEYLYVARIGFNNDFAVYKGGAEWDLDTVADHGTKIGEAMAIRLFPICAEMGLKYRY